MPSTVNSPISKPTSFSSLVECNLPRVTQSLLGNVRLIPLTASAPFTCLRYYKVTIAIAKKVQARSFFVNVDETFKVIPKASANVTW